MHIHMVVKNITCVSKMYVSDVFTANIFTDANLLIIIGPNRPVQTIKACQYIDPIIINSLSKNDFCTIVFTASCIKDSKILNLYYCLLIYCNDNQRLITSL
jgi:hypothetical protein